LEEASFLKDGCNEYQMRSFEKERLGKLCREAFGPDDPGVETAFEAAGLFLLLYLLEQLMIFISQELLSTLLDSSPRQVLWPLVWAALVGLLLIAFSDLVLFGHLSFELNMFVINTVRISPVTISKEKHLISFPQWGEQARTACG
jgi:hypothetical protein